LKSAFQQHGADFQAFQNKTKTDQVALTVDTRTLTEPEKQKISRCQEFCHNLMNPSEQTVLAVYENALRDNNWGAATVAGTNIAGAVTSEVWGINGQQFNQAAGSTAIMAVGAIPVVMLYKAMGKEPPYELLLKIIVAASLAIIPWNSAFAIVFGTWTYSPAVGAWDVFLDLNVHLACVLTGIFESATQNLSPKIFVDPILKMRRGKKGCDVAKETLEEIFSKDTVVAVAPAGWAPGASWAYAWLICAVAGAEAGPSGLAIAATVFVFNYLVAALNPVILKPVECKKSAVTPKTGSLTAPAQSADELKTSEASVLSQKPKPAPVKKSEGWCSYICSFFSGSSEKYSRPVVRAANEKVAGYQALV